MRIFLLVLASIVLVLGFANLGFFIFGSHNWLSLFAAVTCAASATFSAVVALDLD